jgi:2-dehydropantoate 2-reductase
MTTGLCGASRLDLNQIVEHEPARKLQIKLAAEAIRIGLALGYRLEPIRGVAPAQWLAAGRKANLPHWIRSRAICSKASRRRPEGGRSGTAQDLAKGRRTEIDFMNGYVAAKGERSACRRRRMPPSLR